MSSARTTKRKQLKGQTVLGDFFPKPNKPSKSLSSTVKKKFDVKLPSSGTESKSKIEERKEEKTPSAVVSKKTDKIGKKRSDLSGDKEAGEEKRSSLKRKVTGAGMFSFSWTRGSQRDTEQYRNGYPDKEDDPDLTDNFSFYMNKIPSKPDGDYIDKIHVDWWGDYRRLEVHHGYIQWLFPIRESGLNWHAQELQLHEIEKLMKNKKAMKRILTSYKMMLNFYGMKLDNEDDGTIVREENWKNRFIHLNRSYHNYLRITRILKCLGEFGYEHLKKNFVKFVLHEGLAEGTLSNVIESCVKYWIGVLKDDEEREEMFDYYEKLMQDDGLQSKRRNRSPSPPSYWPNKDDDSKINKKQVSKKGRDKKDKVDGDVENEFSDDETVFSDAVKAVCFAASFSLSSVECCSGDEVPHMANDESFSPEAAIRPVDWAMEQAKDTDLSSVLSILRSGSRPRGEEMSKDVKSLLRDFSRLSVKNGILYRTATLDGEEVQQLVIPFSHRNIAFSGVHDNVGHPGRDKSLWLARQRFFWPGMEADFDRRISCCKSCICRKTPVKPAAELVPIQTSRPMQLVCMDFLKLEKSKGGYEDVLVITDHFTRFAKAIPCRNQKATTTARALYENFIVHYSFPEQLHSDQGRNFESRVIKELCNIANVRKTRSTPFHPMDNPSAERFNRTLLRMLGTLAEDHKSKWADFVPSLVQAYNATKNSSTGFSPHFLMFGWHPRLSVDAYLGTFPSTSERVCPSSYVSRLKERLQYAYRLAGDVAKKRADQNKKQYDRKVRENKLVVGDIVLVRKVNLQGRQKLADKWEKDPFVITEIPFPDQPVYKVQLESHKGPIRTLHRNMLLPFISIPEDEELPVKPKPRSKPRRLTVQKEYDADSSSSESSSGVYVIPQRRIPVPRSRNTRVDNGNPSPVSSTLSIPPQSLSSLVPRIHPNPVPVTPVGIPVTPVGIPVTPVGNPVTPVDIPVRPVTTPVTPVSPVSIPSVPVVTPVLTPVSSSHPVPRPRRTIRPPNRYGEWI